MLVILIKIKYYIFDTKAIICIEIIFLNKNISTVEY